MRFVGSMLDLGRRSSLRSLCVKRKRGVCSAASYILRFDGDRTVDDTSSSLEVRAFHMSTRRMALYCDGCGQQDLHVGSIWTRLTRQGTKESSWYSCLFGRKQKRKSTERYYFLRFFGARPNLTPCILHPQVSV